MPNKKDTDEALVRFGENVRSLRKSAGISQEELGNTCILDRTYIGGVERGERNISLRNIIKIAHALNVKTEALVDGCK